MPDQTILHVITGLQDGGAEAVLYRLCTTDKTLRHVVVSLTSEGKYASLLEQRGVAVHVVSPFNLFGLAKLIRITKPLAVHCWMYHGNLLGGIAAKLAGKRAIWSLHHGYLDPGHSKFGTRLINRICAALSGVVPHSIVAVSQSVADIHVAQGYKGVFEIVPNGCDTEYFTPHAALAAIPGGAAQIGMVARWVPEKDHRTLFSAIAHLRRDGWDGLLLLYGAGCVPENDKLLKIIAEFNITDIVVLNGGTDNVPRAMAKLDLHVLSSVGEAFGNVTLEAMACGIPCIATDVGGAREIIGETGWIVPPSDPAGLASAIRSAQVEMENTALWSARKNAARERVVEQFSIKKMVGCYQRIWQAQGNYRRQ